MYFHIKVTRGYPVCLTWVCISWTKWSCPSKAGVYSSYPVSGEDPLAVSRDIPCPHGLCTWVWATHLGLLSELDETGFWVHNPFFRSYTWMDTLSLWRAAEANTSLCWLDRGVRYLSYEDCFIRELKLRGKLGICVRSARHQPNSSV